MTEKRAFLPTRQGGSGLSTPDPPHCDTPASQPLYSLVNQSAAGSGPDGHLPTRSTWEKAPSRKAMNSSPGE